MEYVTLGRTGLKVSVLGLGGGGHSRLGQQTGSTEADSGAIVRRALELGVNFIDTAEAYGTEAIIGAALAGTRRQDLVLSTKKTISVDGRLITKAELIGGLEASLTRLNTEYIDIYHLHGVRPEQYDAALTELVPTLLQQQAAGKIRHLGITEAFVSDTRHQMVAQALHDDIWDVMMVGFNMLNQSARERVFAETMRRGIGVLCMFAVRDALSRPDVLRAMVAELVRQGAIAPDALDPQHPLGFVEQVAESIPEAAYRFCRAEPGIHVVLSGTGKQAHLEQNIAAILRPSLPASVHTRLKELFAGIDTVSGQ